MGGGGAGSSGPGLPAIPAGVSVVGVCEAADEAKVVAVGDEARVDGKRSRVLPRVHANWMGAKSMCGLGLNVCCILLSNPACGLG